MKTKCNWNYLLQPQNWHPESCHKWLGSTPTYKRPVPRVTAHALPKPVLWNFILFPFLSHTTHASPQKQHSQAQRTCGGNRCPDSMPPCADDCAPWCMFRAEDVRGILKLNMYWTKKVWDHELQQKSSSQIWKDSDVSIFTLVKTLLATI